MDSAEINQRKKVIMDVDTGSDDAIALMLALLAPELDVVAVCTVWGNVSLENTTGNTLRLLSRMGRRVPVYTGLKEALSKNLAKERRVVAKVEAKIEGKVVKMHEDQFQLPGAAYEAETEPAPFFYHRYLTASEDPVHLIAVGPLTNLGYALSLWPELADKIASLTIMGGGYNVSNIDHAEGNFWQDPEAAQIVLDSGIDPLLVPLDATHEAIITGSEIEELRSNGNFPSTFAADLLDQRRILHTQIEPLRLDDAATVHDAVAVAALLDPAVLCDVRSVHCDIGIGGASEGHCSIDRRESHVQGNCRFAYSADREKFVHLLINTLKQGQA